MAASEEPPVRMGMVSTYPPRRSGLAGYAGGLAHALSTGFDVVVCAVDRRALNYPDEVVAVVAEDDREDYRRAARILAEHAVDAVLVQHDDGVYGGPAGSHVLDLVDELRLRGIPYVVCLHSVRRGTDPVWARTTAALTAGAAQVLVLAEEARRLVVGHHLVRADRVSVVPPGVPMILRGAHRRGVPPSVRPALAGALEDGRRILSTFGMVGPGRGLETAVCALPKIVAGHPDVRYVIAGATAAGTADGEGYRDQLRDLVAELDLTEHVRIINAYLTPVELSALLGHTDVYLAPNIRPDRTCSGPLAHAVAAGCAAVAAYHAHSVELLSGGAGEVVPPGEIERLAEAVDALLGDPVRLAAARAAADQAGRRLGWPAVANHVAALVRRAVDQHRRQRVVLGGLPPIQLTRTGTGGAVDDTERHARRAVVAAGVLALGSDVLPPACWLTAAEWATQSLDVLSMRVADVGWALWGTGALADGPGVPEPLREEARSARESLAAAMPDGLDLPASAHAVLGLVGSRSSADLRRLARRLDAALANAGRGAGWPWFADRLATGGVRVAQALVAAGRRLGDAAMIGRGVESLDWYARRVGLATADGMPRLSDPAEVGALVEALVEVYRATGSAHHARLARPSFGWFLGANGSAELAVDGELCRVGLGADQAGTKLGTLAYLGALLCLISADLLVPPPAGSSQRDLASAA